MNRHSFLPQCAVLTSLLIAAGCGSTLQRRPPVVAAPASTTATSATSPLPPVDPVSELIAISQRHFTTGEAEMLLGHLERARAAFNRAIEVLLDSPKGARTDPRLREHFDRLVNRVSSYEIAALTTGDGFTEQWSESASLDELLSLATFEPGEATPGLHEAVESDLLRNTYDIPITLNPRVVAYIDLFQGRLRGWIEDGLRRGGRYLPMIQNVFRAEGLPLDLAYVPLIESAFKPTAVSRAKATGVWQFMRATALANGLEQDWYIDERFDPEKATVAAAKYLRSLHDMFKGDWHLALASYNGGPGRVQRAIKRSGRTDFWKLSQSTGYLPRETREYVPMILAAIVIARNPVQYGFDLEALPPIAYEKVPVPGAVDLRRVAEWTGTSIEEIQALNPELRRWTTPVSYQEYEIKVPPGTSDLLVERLAGAAPGDLAALNWHTVKKGESLATIARQLSVNRTDLAQANDLKTTAQVKAGQKLIIPRAPTLLLAGGSSDPAPPVAPPSLASRTIAAVDAPHGAPPGTEKLVYQVKHGDTLFSIARVFQTTVASLRLWNKISGSRINPGDMLTVFTTRGLGSIH
jgi:membrane-bound lytic murein transglycosylase D